MSTVAEIEAAIKQLPKAELEALALWLETMLLNRATPPAVDRWLERARGAAVAGMTTDAVMALTRGNE
ncbi:MAG: hypothetical protein ABSG31_02705 [Tepidisphaeraceae bacterium]|jgi:hypothetical protein